MRRHRRDARRAVDQTVLAYRRTAIQVGLVGLAAVRMLSEHLGWWVLGAGAVALVLTFAVQRAASTYADTVDQDGEVAWAPHGTGHATVRHALVAGATGVVAVLAAAWLVLQV